MQKKAGEIARLLGGKVEGNPDQLIQSLNSFELSKSGDLTFAGSDKYLKKLGETQASCILVGEGFEGKMNGKTLIKVKDPKQAFVMILVSLHKSRKKKPGVHPTAVIAENVSLGKDIAIGPYVILEDGVKIGNKVEIGANTVVGENTTIEEETVIYPNVSIYHDIVIGKRVILNSGCVVGADGFGYYEKEGAHHKIPQTGNVVIEDDVELGSNDTIDRATFGSTVIGKGSKLDDMVHVAHNCLLGKNVIICGQAGVAGSTLIEDNVVMGAQAGLKDHIKVGKSAVIGAKAAVKEDVKPGEYVLGMPAQEARNMAKHWAAQARLTRKAKTLLEMAKEFESKESVKQ